MYSICRCGAANVRLLSRFHSFLATEFRIIFILSFGTRITSHSTRLESSESNRWMALWTKIDKRKDRENDRLNWELTVFPEHIEVVTEKNLRPQTEMAAVERDVCCPDFLSIIVPMGGIHFPFNQRPLHLSHIYKRKYIFRTNPRLQECRWRSI